MSRTASELCSGLTVLNMREPFIMINRMDMVGKYSQTGNITRVSLETGKRMDRAFFKISMAANTKVNGKTINSTDLAKKFGIMEMKLMRDSFLMAKKMAAVDSYGKMVPTMKAISLMDSFMGQVHTILKRQKKLTPEGL